jgi:glycosyltransferase involved in cell wall biosynthesis
MRILHVTNIISHHQLPLARQLASLVGVENFRFATTETPNIEREKLGWNSLVNESWLLRVGEREEDRKEFEQWWDEADVVLCGERRFKRMQDRLDKGKLTFYMSERWWKPPIDIARVLHPRFALMTLQFLKLASSPLFHYLPMGSIAADDIRRITKFQGRMWQWGYFTEQLNAPLICERQGDELKVLWAGRMLAWKRVDTLIHAFSLEKLAEELLFAGSYQFLPSVSAPRVLELMQQHHVYVLPSNRYEGWGAVINEAMSVGCTVVASDGAGAAKTMIEHQHNGLLFQSGDWQTLSDHLILLAQNDTIRQQLARQGQRTITNYWSPTVAAERFLTVSEAIMSKRSVPTFDNGPMVLLNTAEIN